MDLSRTGFVLLVAKALRTSSRRASDVPARCAGAKVRGHIGTTLAHLSETR